MEPFYNSELIIIIELLNTIILYYDLAILWMMSESCNIYKSLITQVGPHSKWKINRLKMNCKIILKYGH